MQSPQRNAAGRKRSRGTPTFHTPVRPLKRVPLREIAQDNPLVVPPRRLVVPDPAKVLTPAFWSKDEVKALIEFIHVNCKSDCWPSHHSMNMWTAAGSFVKSKLSTRHQRSGIYIYRACQYIDS